MIEHHEFKNEPKGWLDYVSKWWLIVIVFLACAGVGATALLIGGSPRALEQLDAAGIMVGIVLAVLAMVHLSHHGMSQTIAMFRFGEKLQGLGDISNKLQRTSEKLELLEPKLEHLDTSIGEGSKIFGSALAKLTAPDTSDRRAGADSPKSGIEKSTYEIIDGANGVVLLGLKLCVRIQGTPENYRKKIIEFLSKSNENSTVSSVMLSSIAGAMAAWVHIAAKLGLFESRNEGVFLKPEVIEQINSLELDDSPENNYFKPALPVIESL
jgi:hypothetical protein